MANNDDPRGPGAAPATAPIDHPAPAGTSTGPATAEREANGVPPEELAGAGRPHIGTRTSHTWAGLSAGLFFLVVVLVFILQNLKSARVHFFWATWTIPLAVDLLLAAVLGGLLMFAVGSLRIVQLRRAARRGTGSGPPRPA